MSRATSLQGRSSKATPSDTFAALRGPSGHIDIAEARTAEGKLRLFVAIDRTSRFTYAELHQEAGKIVAAQFLRNLIAAVPYAIHTVLTDNGIEHRLTKIKHPWANGQVECMNRTIKEATVKRFHNDDHGQLQRHLADFINAYNYARRLKTLKGLPPNVAAASRTERPDKTEAATRSRKSLE